MLRVASLVNLKYLGAFVLVLVEQVFIIPHDGLRSSFRVLQLREKHSDLHTVPITTFFCFKMVSS